MDRFEEYINEVLPKSWMRVPTEGTFDALSTSEKRVKERDYLASGRYPVIDQGQKFIGGYYDDISKVIAIDHPVIVFGDHTKVIKLIDKSFVPGADGVKVLSPKKYLQPKLFRYFLEVIAKRMPDKGYARHFQYIDNFSFPVPPYNEQARIIDKIEELFSDLDKSIESLKTAQEQLKIYRQSLLKSAFEGKLTIEWRRKNKSELLTTKQITNLIGSERASRSSDIKLGQAKKFNDIRLNADEIPIELGELPKGWTWIHIGHISTGPSYGTSSKSDASGKCSVLRMGNIQNCEFDWTDLVYTSDKEEMEKYRLKKGDVLFNRTNSPELVGKTAIFEGKRDSIFAGYLVRVNHIPTLVDPYYLNFFLNSPVARLYGNKVKTDGVNQSNINAEKLSYYPFPYCSLEEQQEVSQRLLAEVSEINKLDDTLSSEILRADGLRQSILKEAFSGKLVPQDPADEPASVLLERLKAELQNTNGNGAHHKVSKGKKKK